MSKKFVLQSLQSCNPAPSSYSAESARIRNRRSWQKSYPTIPNSRGCCAALVNMRVCTRWRVHGTCVCWWFEIPRHSALQCFSLAVVNQGAGRTASHPTCCHSDGQNGGLPWMKNIIWMKLDKMIKMIKIKWMKLLYEWSYVLFGGCAIWRSISWAEVGRAFASTGWFNNWWVAS